MLHLLIVLLGTSANIQSVTSVLLYKEELVSMYVDRFLPCKHPAEHADFPGFAAAQ